ncbi:unnamed protein product [Amoebophrya sp. A25]|nr:unnamed protein product [Amoebophrya sp. A25]|eukprot:GSA25T00017222001.1
MELWGMVHSHAHGDAKKRPQSFRISCQKSKFKRRALDGTRMKQENENRHGSSSGNSSCETTLISSTSTTTSQQETSTSQAQQEQGSPLISLSTADLCRKTAGIVLNIEPGLKAQMENFDLEVALVVNEEEILVHIPIFQSSGGENIAEDHGLERTSDSLLEGDIKRRSPAEAPTRATSSHGGRACYHVSGLSRPVCFAMARSLDLKPGETVLDPMCGKGGLLLETLPFLQQQLRAERAVSTSTNFAPTSSRLIGIDQSEEQVAGCLVNAESHQIRPRLEVLRGGPRLEVLSPSYSKEECQDKVKSEEILKLTADLKAKHGLLATKSGTSKSLQSSTDGNKVLAAEVRLASRQEDSQQKTSFTVIQGNFQDSLEVTDLKDDILQASLSHVDAVLCDLPFGKQFGCVADNHDRLHPGFANFLVRILKPDKGRFVLLTSAENLDSLCEHLLSVTVAAPHGKCFHLTITERRWVTLGNLKACIVVGKKTPLQVGEKEHALLSPPTNLLSWESTRGRNDWQKEKLKMRPRLRPT